MLTDEQLEQFRQAREGPYGWRDCEICGNFVMPGEPECPSPGCALVRVARSVGEKMAAKREADQLAAFLDFVDSQIETTTPPGPDSSPSSCTSDSDSTE